MGEKNIRNRNRILDLLQRTIFMSQHIRFSYSFRNEEHSVFYTCSMVVEQKIHEPTYHLEAKGATRQRKFSRGDLRTHEMSTYDSFMWSQVGPVEHIYLNIFAALNNFVYHVMNYAILNQYIDSLKHGTCVGFRCTTPKYI